MIIQLKTVFTLLSKQSRELLEGLLFLGPSCGKYLKEDISARHARASLTLKHITPPPAPHPFLSLSLSNSFPVSYV